MKDFIIDYETFGGAPDGVTIDLACVVFEMDPHNPPTFKQLVNDGIRSKFSLEDQKAFGSSPRIIDADTVKWWKEQSEEARAGLKPSELDVSLKVGVEKVLNFIVEKGCQPWKTQGWARGMSFDFGIMVDQLRQIYKTRNTFDLEPCKFWNQRDVRTFIEATLMTRGMTECPLPAGTLDGFVAHNSVHDCAKDVLMMVYAVRYALGLEDVPTEETADPRSLKKKRN